MERNMGTLALVATCALCLAVAHGMAGIQWPVALVLLVGGALAAGFAASTGKAAVAAGRHDRPALGRAAGLVIRILSGAVAIACMVAGGLWWVARLG